MDLVRHFEQQQITGTDRPLLRSGDIVRVEMKVQEGGKTRRQAFEGTVLAIRGSGPSATFTVRRETGNFGVERIFPLYSPLITEIEIVKRQKVRRAKLSYLRQEGRRRFKEDVRAMQRHVQEESDKKRLVEQAEKKKLEEAAAAEAKAAKAEKAEAEKQDSPSPEATAKQGPESTDEKKDEAPQAASEAKNPS
ncbi:MAG TPA: 50S ribosomal protein L19 [Candidatus Andersenbacteria bacterium]|nr:50S ribosomal protein L19 [Candidatus Andersenbacteria bacterium]